MTSAQPGQEQRMVTDAMIEAGWAVLAASGITDDLLDADKLTVAEIYTAMEATRPTADLGEDGELVERAKASADYLRRCCEQSYSRGKLTPIVTGDIVDAAEWLSLIADRLILYREAAAQANVDILTTLGAVRDNMPAEAVAIFQRIARDLDAVLSRSGH